MGKDIGRIYKHGQYQISTLSIKEIVISYSDSQTLSSIESKITPASSVIEKKNQFHFVFSRHRPEWFKHHK